eukprot:1188331-Prorocentrum_minimum.AAC.1
MLRPYGRFHLTKLPPHPPVDSRTRRITAAPAGSQPHPLAHSRTRRITAAPAGSQPHPPDHSHTRRITATPAGSHVYSLTRTAYKPFINARADGFHPPIANSHPLLSTDAREAHRRRRRRGPPLAPPRARPPRPPPPPAAGTFRTPARHTGFSKLASSQTNKQTNKQPHRRKERGAAAATQTKRPQPPPPHRLRLFFARAARSFPSESLLLVVG